MRQIFCIDDMPPEATAMIQALYSRDPRSVTEHLKKVDEVGAEKFMASFYVGYGHKSIGDCGTTTLFVENVSMFVAKAIQDWPLYNGQEASTRYLDMSKQPIVNPLGTDEGRLIQDTWMVIYKEVLAALVPFLKEQFPRSEDQPEGVYNKAINAKAFDIARGLLPGGVTTLVSWHTNLRQAYDHLQRLQHHPLREVASVAEDIHAALKAKYPDSFSHKVYQEQETWLADAERELAYFHEPLTTDFEWFSTLDRAKLHPYLPLLANRPAKTEMPHTFEKCGQIQFSFPLDFGSFRDLQRHRNCVMMMPLLTTELGFLPWYLEQLPDRLRYPVEENIRRQEARIAKLDCSMEVRQYYIAMGYAVSCEVTAGLPAAIYIAELRSSQTVHPTLRSIAQKMGNVITNLCPDIALHCDMSPDKWTIKRGTHDISKK